MVGKTNVGGENVKAEVEYQTPIIAQILEGLVGKAQGANATAETILKGFSAYVEQQLVNGTYDPATADPDLIPENIREGVDIFGVLGTMVEGVSGIDYGTFTLTSSYNSTVTVSHNLGVKPAHIIAILTQNFSLVTSANCNVLYKGASNGLVGYSSSNWVLATNDSTADENSITFKTGNFYFEPNARYHWIAIA